MYTVCRAALGTCMIRAMQPVHAARTYLGTNRITSIQLGTYSVCTYGVREPET